MTSDATNVLVTLRRDASVKAIYAALRKLGIVPRRFHVFWGATRTIITAAAPC